MESRFLPETSVDASTVNKKFQTPEEELVYLRGQVAEKEKALFEQGIENKREDVIKHQISTYKDNSPENFLHESFKIPDSSVGEILLDLAPESHDKQIEGLIHILYEKGVMNALSVVEALNNPHLEDDFHRFLVEYMKKGFPVNGLKEGSNFSKSLKHTLFEVSLPEAQKSEQTKQLKEILSSMEQFYAGMLSVQGKNRDDHFSIELAIKQDSQEFIFYVSVPDDKIAMFEKHVLSIFSSAKLIEQKDDYNIFNPNGVALGSTADQSKNPIYPIKTYHQFDYDPLNMVLNAFSKIKHEGEGAAIQIIIKPRSDYYVTRYKDALEEINKGVPLKKAIDIRHSIGGEFAKLGKELTSEFGKEFAGALFGSKKKDNDKNPVIDEIALENIKNKISTPIVEANIRIVVSAENRARANEILNDIESSFNQFENTLGNTLKFKKVEKAADLTKLIRAFSFRTFSDYLAGTLASEDPSGRALPLSLSEITSMLHFPGESVVSTPQLRQSKSGTASAPLGMPHEGVLLGVNKHRNLDTNIFITPEDRLRHFYVIGQTGTGKTTMLKNMIIQDIKNGDGVCFIDPHGSDVQDILANIPPERYEDVIYFDPAHTARPMGLNMLEYNPESPEQKTFVVNELFSIFQKLYGGVPESMGPMFEQYFRNATMLVIEDPSTGCTLLDVSRVMAVKSFRDLKISRCKNPVVVQFWKEIAEKAGGEGALANMVPYITSKFDVFLANEIMRPIIAQEQSAFDFREIMDNKKILLVNLSKGRLGTINSNLLGLILVGKILMAALSRVDSFGKKELPPFYLYIDEFQNITTDSISVILSEARKYKLSLTIAHQFIAQLDEKIKDAVFGNVGSMAVYRVGSDDAEFLAKQFEPVFTAQDIMGIDNFNAYLKILVEGKPVRPFNIEKSGFPPKGSSEVAEKLKELSYLKFGRARDEVDEEILKKYKKEPVVTSNPLEVFKK